MSVSKLVCVKSAGSATRQQAIANAAPSADQSADKGTAACRHRDIQNIAVTLVKTSVPVYAHHTSVTRVQVSCLRICSIRKNRHHNCKHGCHQECCDIFSHCF